MKKSILVLSCLSFQLVFSSSAVHKDNQVKVVSYGAISEDSKQKYIIGGDITNTDVVIGVFQAEKDKPVLMIEYISKSKDISDLYQHLKNILDDLQKRHKVKISDACFAIPGVASGDLFLHPHLPWNTSDDVKKHSDSSQRGISKQKFLAVCRLSNIYFINDFQAVAIGTQAADSSSIMTLQQGLQNHTKPKLVIGAGNGLGASLLMWDSALNGYVPSQLNYSFTEFGAQSDLEFDFFNYLKNTTGNVAWGKVLGAGAGGIKLIYRFFDDFDSNKEPEMKKYAEEEFVDYPNYLDIFKNCSNRCQDAVNFYVNAYARIIRNAAYAQSVLGGVYITNTVVQENMNIFATESFLQKIVNLEGIVLDEGSKKYLENYLTKIPFYVVTDPKVSLYGAASLCLEPNLIRN